MGGSLDFAIVSPTVAAPFLQSQRFTALGVTSAKRFPALPNVSVLGEHPQVKGYELSGWFAVAALKAGLADPVFRRRLEDRGSLPATGGEDLARVKREDMDKYRQLVKFANMRDLDPATSGGQTQVLAASPCNHDRNASKAGRLACRSG